MSTIDAIKMQETNEQRDGFAHAIRLNVGTGWEPDHLGEIFRLNSEPHQATISGVFGGLPSSMTRIRSARPDFRIPPSTWEQFAHSVALCKNNNIEVSFTLNGPLVQSVTEIKQSLAEIRETISIIVQSGVDRLIVANPLLIEIVRNTTSLPITLSTIAQSHYSANLIIYRDWGIDRVCPDIYLNRRPNFLERYVGHAKSLGIEVELLANEFCFAGHSPCAGVLRDACYAHSALGGNPGADFADWPFGMCRQLRATVPESTLRAPYILPHHLPWYSRSIGVNLFKIAGRTKSVAERIVAIRMYSALASSGPLSNLWMEPNSSGDHISNLHQIDIDHLEAIGFFSRWISDHPKDCDYDCGLKCSWCLTHWDKLTSLLLRERGLQ